MILPEPDPERARQMYQDAVRKGVIAKLTRCDYCPAVGKIHGHHTDYSKPYQVQARCSRCHRKVHRRFVMKDVPRLASVAPGADMLRDFRLAHGITLEQAAKGIGTVRACILAWERGTVRPKPIWARRIAEWSMATDPITGTRAPIIPWSAWSTAEEVAELDKIVPFALRPKKERGRERRPTNTGPVEYQGRWQSRAEWGRELGVSRQRIQQMVVDGRIVRNRPRAAHSTKTSSVAGAGTNDPGTPRGYRCGNCGVLGHNRRSCQRPAQEAA